MIEIGRDIAFCDPYLNRDADDDWIRREKGKKYAAARKAEWEQWQTGEEDLPQFGSTRTANRGQTWQHVGKVAAALAAASSVPRGDAAKAVAVLRKEFSIAYYITNGSNWSLYMTLAIFIVVLFLAACFWMHIRRRNLKDLKKTAATQTEETGAIAGDIYISPAGECYHKATNCRGLKVARSYSARRPCNVCVE